ncbi:hypothetical protein K493DRAFT_298977 [Basidiobolus meristosporus CBS 931.73]|uniref:Carrier domain-containing protein n=1 Tax=Basidiobolus meristosporus CBS 931.73 TaxID=1314790 RepID=A0A1Y1YQ94_9FUNG|nr:hypothetical protein K493DRAFT_298977 [Basidiobolus meristosporus CBS 931.73]|eukprot:ORY00193.1 hypothetical protein K493DRAFT_298977 [Basidiobolus meristosporus CBS 931.73]
MAVALEAILPQFKILITGGDAPDCGVITQVMRNAPPQQLLNAYGPTESTTFTTTYRIAAPPGTGTEIPIGRPIANTRLYLLDKYGQPLPLGMIGELYIGGDGVACGYLNRPELTAERFLPDPFSKHKNARMYRTGDLARYMPDGNLVFLGRSDQQVKIRGFRIEPGEIEACLNEHPQVREATVLVLGKNNSKRLVAYVVAEPNKQLAHTLRLHLTNKLPEYMIPAAFVQLDVLPLTPNGKVDRRALPEPKDESFAHQEYEAPQGELETVLAAIWAELLKLEQIGRHDNFFALGGNSLLVMQMIERLRRLDLRVSVRALYDTPTLSTLVQSLGQHSEVPTPPNLITPNTSKITPDLLPLVNLTQAEIDQIIEVIPGGVSNIQDIYSLTPLQDGILFHHLLETDNDPYLVTTLLAFADRPLLDRYLETIQQLVNRHDILRTAFVWRNLTAPVQVVCRQALLSISELTFDLSNGPIRDQLLRYFDPHKYRVDLTQASLLRYAVTQDTDGRWLLVQLLHHVIGDHSTVDVMQSEIQAFLSGQGSTLPPPQPFRNLVAQARLGRRQKEHEQFFTEMLADIEEPTLPFGLGEIYRDGSKVTESHQMLPQDLNKTLRAQAKRLGVSVADLFHLAWAQVLARSSGQERVVFGTVLLGRMQAGDGADQALGLFINTLPIRIDLGERGVQESVQQTHADLAALLQHEHASLALAQRCSSLPAGTPLFSALLNYRHNTVPLGKHTSMSGIEFLSTQERTNYPLLMSVEDFGDSLGLTSQAVYPLDSAQICNYMRQTLQSLVDALQHKPEMPIHQIEVLSDDERERLLGTLNATDAPYSEHRLLHQLFEEQAERTPQATALVCEGASLNYAELNIRANYLAQHLIELGVQPDTRVAICMQRGPQMIMGLLAILKSGGAYVPLDPAYPCARLAQILADATPMIIVADSIGCSVLGEAVLSSRTIVDPDRLPGVSLTNPQIPKLTARHLAYVIYTSGSTGIPKGVMMEHRGIVNLAQARKARFEVHPSSRILQFASLSFDVSIWEIILTLSTGASLYLPPDIIRHDLKKLWEYIARYSVTHAILPPALLQDGEGLPRLETPLTLILTGEAANAALYQNLSQHGAVYNAYGPTETHAITIWASQQCSLSAGSVPIGRPIENTRLYLVDRRGQLVPYGAVGELYIAGVCVARGYLNRPELTSERFLPDPFSKENDTWMYKTGDLARYLPDGNLEFLGRNDHQIKIRGFRIEPGEIKTLLLNHPQVREAFVMAQGKDHNKHLVAYVVAEPDESLARTLRNYLSKKLPEYMTPSAFLRLDELPLTPNGKIDRQALPTPDHNSFALPAYEAPQGTIECTLAGIWAELLDVDRIGRHDNFFALGGYSLLAVRMTSRIHTALHVEPPLRMLFEAPTIAELAQRLLELDDHPHDSYAVLFPIQPKGTLAPLFCVHAVSGLSWGYVGLSQHLDPDQPIYGLQARGLNNNAPLAESIEAMASDYIKQIRSIQPHGPYHLLGWSFGVYVAHSMATQLENQGEAVALLAMLDSNPEYTPRAEETEAERDDAYKQFLSRYSDGGIPNAGEYLWGKTESVIKNNLELVKKFTPLTVRGDVLFFRATIPEHEDIPLITPELWKPHVLGDIEVHNIHCKHREMDRPTPTAEIGRILAKTLHDMRHRPTRSESWWGVLRRDVRKFWGSSDGLGGFFDFRNLPCCY